MMFLFFYGNTVQHESADGSQHNLYYDLYDRLEKAEVFRRNESGGWDKQTWVYQYDALDRRIRKGRLKEDGGLEDETRFVWDGSRLLQEVYARGRYTYVYADQDSYEPLAQIHNYTNAGFEICQDINNFQFRLYNPIFTMEHHYEKCFESLGHYCFRRICFVCIRSRYAQAQAFGV